MMGTRIARFLFVSLLVAGSNGWLTNNRPLYNLLSKRNLLLVPTRRGGEASSQPSTLTSLFASKFSQPAFSQPAFSGKGKSKQTQAKQERKPVVRKFGGDSKIASLHAQRIKTAGRVGTKRYVDPCKVFFGNLPFNVTENMLETWISDQMGVPAPLLLQQVKVIRDWKTGNSKGYGFAVFTEAIQATVCIEKCNRQLMGGRPLSVDQGKKKESTQIIVKKKKKPPVDAEEAAIQAGLEEVSKPRMDPQEALMWRQLDPDLVDDDFENDDGLFDEDDMDDDDGVDGFFVEDEDDDTSLMGDDDTPMNRKRRRELARQKKRRKPANKGFGS